MPNFKIIRASVGRFCFYVMTLPVVALIVKTFMPDAPSRQSDEAFLLGATGLLLVAGLAALGVGGQLRLAIAHLLRLDGDFRRHDGRPDIKPPAPVEVKAKRKASKSEGNGKTN